MSSDALSSGGRELINLDRRLFVCATMGCRLLTVLERLLTVVEMLRT